MPIKSFRHKGLRLLVEKDYPSKVLSGSAARKQIRNILFALDTAASISDMQQFPAWTVHALKGNQRGRWAAKVTGNQRVTFGFEDGNAIDVDLEDYH